MAADGYLQLAQELTYQWMGNLVTTSWWSEAHLNKALVGYIAADTAIKVFNNNSIKYKILFYSKKYNILDRQWFRDGRKMADDNFILSLL